MAIILTGNTLSGFTRPTDPINQADLSAALSTAIGKTVICSVTATDILVTGSGSTLVLGDGTASQTAITAYQFGYLQYGAPISDIFPMTSGIHNIGVTEAVAYAGDLATRRKAYVSGVLKNDSFLYVSKASTVSGGLTFYITDDGTSSGNAVFTNVYADSIAINAYGTSGTYQPSAPTVSVDKKSVTANISQATNVLGILTFNSTAANGIDCRLYVMGD